jgi:hypothetical protein
VQVLAELIAAMLEALLGSAATGGSRKRGQRTTRGMMMGYPRSMALTGLIMAFGFPIFFMVALALGQPSSVSELLGPAAVFVVISAGSAWLWWEARTRRILVTNDAIIRVLRAGRRKRIRWADVTQVRRSFLAGGYVITDGKVHVVVSALLTGQAQFARQALDAVPKVAREACEHLLVDAVRREST